MVSFSHFFKKKAFFPFFRKKKKKIEYLNYVKNDQKKLIYFKITRLFLLFKIIQIIRL